MPGTNFHNYPRHVFEQYDDASVALDAIRKGLDTNGKLSVADYYDIVGDLDNKDDKASKYGWYDLKREPAIRKVADGKFTVVLGPIKRLRTSESNWSSLEEAIAKAVRKDTLPTSDATFDTIANPAHYCEGRKYEPRKVIADWELNFYLGNTVKYISRAGRKDTGKTVDDLKKAKQYLEWEIERLEEIKE